MKHFLTLILRYIIGQKGRSLLAVAGLVTAVALISAAGILGANISAGYVEQARPGSTGPALSATWVSPARRKTGWRSLERHMMTQPWNWPTWLCWKESCPGNLTR